MEIAVIPAVARYLFLTSLDEQLSFAAGLKVMGELRSNNWLASEHRVQWIRVLNKWRKKLPFLKTRTWDTFSGRGFDIPRGLDLVVWSSFLTAAEETEVEAVLLSIVLNFSDDEIAEALDVTAGTVRYRVGRGLRHLGGFIES